MPSGIQNAFNRLSEAIGDLSSLEVQTLTGDISATLGTAAGDQPDTGGSIIDWKKAIAAARAEGKVKLVAATLINFDGDVTQYIASGEQPAHLLTAHKDAIAAGLETRAHIVDFAARTLGLKLK